MLKVATDLQGSGHSVQLNDSPAATPRLELEKSGEEIILNLFSLPLASGLSVSVSL